MAKFHRETDLCRKVRSVQNFRFQQPGQIPIAITQKSLTVWSQKMDHQKAERVTYQVSIWKSGSFSLGKAFVFPSTAVLHRTDFSSVIDAQNFVSSKPLVV
jgi:hypothetical protein